MPITNLRGLALAVFLASSLGPTTVFGAAPLFTLQPSTLSAGVGTTAGFDAAASNATNYQWQISFTGSVWVPIDNFIWSAGTADTQSLRLPLVPLLLNNCSIRCLAYSGTSFALSNTALLYVTANPSNQVSLIQDPGGRFLAQNLASPPPPSQDCDYYLSSPPFHRPLLLGATPSVVTFSPTYSGGSGGGYTVQWFLSTDGGTTWNLISSGGRYVISGDAQTIYVPVPVSTDNGNLFRAIVTDKNNGSSITTNPGRLDVSDPIVSNSDIYGDGLNDGSTTAKVNTTASFRVTASGASELTYLWQLSTDFGTTWTDAGSTAATLYVPVTSMAQNQNMYRCVVTDSAGSTNSDPMLLTTIP